LSYPKKIMPTPDINAPQIEAYWQAFLESLPEQSLQRAEALQKIPMFVAEAWGDNPELADKLAALIVAGTKTASCSSLWDWEIHQESLPEIGLKTIVLNGQNEPVCIVETTSIFIQKFQDVDADFAFAEGENDRTLETWRTGHWRYFTRTLEPLGLKPTLEMPLVCEHFKVIFR
jgi:uncharacterized protein YhfF